MTVFILSVPGLAQEKPKGPPPPLVAVAEVKAGKEYREAVRESTRTRLRPIFMTALTIVFGMLPLVLVPGPGSEFYRGLGSVVLGGLMISTFFTIFVIPALLLFFIGREKSGAEEPLPE